MTSIKDMVVSVFETSKDRLKNPIIGAFVLSWLAINWRIVMILLFSSEKIEDKINYIETHYFYINYNLWIPLGFAIFYILALPYLMVLFDWLSQKGVQIRRLISKNHRILRFRINKK